MPHIRIVETPPGEAPVKVRAAWVGVTIPLAEISESQPSIWAIEGVLGKEHGLLARFKRFFGILPADEQPYIAYVVDVVAAVDALRAQSPSAAAWWERHTPHPLKPGERFCFAASCCEELP